MESLLWAVFFVGGLMGAGWALVQVHQGRAPDEWDAGEDFGVSR